MEVTGTLKAERSRLIGPPGVPRVWDYKISFLAEEGSAISEGEPVVGFDATELRVDFHVKLAEPLACLVLPAAILFFAVGGPPFPGPAQTVLASAILGVSYILLTGVAATIGYGGTLPPALAAWSPTAFYGVVAGYFGWRLWRRL